MKQDYKVTRYVMETVVIKDADSRADAVEKAKTAKVERNVQREECFALQRPGKAAENTVSPVGVGISPDEEKQEAPKKDEKSAPARKSSKKEVSGSDDKKN